MNQLAPIPTQFTRVIATRAFDVIQDGITSRLVVEIGMPIQDVETVTGLDWRCPVRCTQGSSVQELRACGVDSLQALQLALRLVHNELERMREDKRCQILLFNEPYSETM